MPNMRSVIAGQVAQYATKKAGLMDIARAGGMYAKSAVLPWAKRHALTLGMMGGGAAMNRYGDATDNDFLKIGGAALGGAGFLGNKTLRSTLTSSGRNRLLGRFSETAGKVARGGINNVMRMGQDGTTNVAKAQGVMRSSAVLYRAMNSASSGKIAGQVARFNNSKFGRTTDKHANKFMNFFDLGI